MPISVVETNDLGPEFEVGPVDDPTHVRIKDSGIRDRAVAATLAGSILTVDVSGTVDTVDLSSLGTGGSSPSLVDDGDGTASHGTDSFDPWNGTRDVLGDVDAIEGTGEFFSYYRGFWRFVQDKVGTLFGFDALWKGSDGSMTRVLGTQDTADGHGAVANFIRSAFASVTSTNTTFLGSNGFISLIDTENVADADGARTFSQVRSDDHRVSRFEQESIAGRNRASISTQDLNNGTFGEVFSVDDSGFTLGAFFDGLEAGMKRTGQSGEQGVAFNESGMKVMTKSGVPTQSGLTLVAVNPFEPYVEWSATPAVLDVQLNVNTTTPALELLVNGNVVQQLALTPAGGGGWSIA